MKLSTTRSSTQFVWLRIHYWLGRRGGAVPQDLRKTDRRRVIRLRRHLSSKTTHQSYSNIGNKMDNIRSRLRIAGEPLNDLHQSWNHYHSGKAHSSKINTPNARWAMKSSREFSSTWSTWFSMSPKWTKLEGSWFPAYISSSCSLRGPILERRLSDWGESVRGHSRTGEVCEAGG